MHKPVDSRAWLDYNLPFRMVDAVRFFSVLFFYRGFYYYYRAQNARLNRSV